MSRQGREAKPRHGALRPRYDRLRTAIRCDARDTARRGACAAHGHDTAAGPATRRLCAVIRPARHPRHGAGQAATRPRARGLGVQAELWLCTWCTWTVFDSLLFLSR